MNPRGFPGFERITSVGKGANGEVFKAWDPMLSRWVAIKVLREQDAGDLDVLRFLEEARIMARYPHETLVPIHDLEPGPPARMVLGWRGGGDLGTRLAIEGAFPLEDVCRVGIRIAQALGHLHSHRILHRDLKLGNYLTDEDGQIFLGDLGLAAVSRSGLTRTGHVVGTLSNLAPEVISKEAYSPQSDFFALGVSLLELARGSHSSYAGHQTEKLEADLDRIRPRALADFLRGLTAPDPKDRPHDAGAIEAQLWKLAPSRLLRSQRLTLPPPDPQRRQRRKRRRQVALGLAWLFSLVGVFLIAEALLNPTIRTPPKPPGLARSRGPALSVLLVEAEVQTQNFQRAVALELEGSPSYRVRAVLKRQGVGLDGSSAKFRDAVERFADPRAPALYRRALVANLALWQGLADSAYRNEDVHPLHLERIALLLRRDLGPVLEAYVRLTYDVESSIYTDIRRVSAATVSQSEDPWVDRLQRLRRRHEDLDSELRKLKQSSPNPSPSQLFADLVLESLLADPYQARALGYFEPAADFLESLAPLPLRALIASRSGDLALGLSKDQRQRDTGLCLQLARLAPGSHHVLAEIQAQGVTSRPLLESLYPNLVLIPLRLHQLCPGTPWNPEEEDPWRLWVEAAAWVELDRKGLLNLRALPTQDAPPATDAPADPDQLVQVLFRGASSQAKDALGVNP